MGNCGIEELEKIVPSPKNFISDVRKLDVFCQAYDISIIIHKRSLLFPKIEQYSLADQMRRASKSVCANIAEGFIKQSHSKLEFKRYITISLGSSNEMQLWSSYAFDLGYIERNEFQKWTQTYNSIIAMLISLRNKIK